MNNCVHKLVQIVQILRSQTHFYSAFRYGDQQGVSPMWRCVVSRCSRHCLTILVHIPNHFIAPTVFSSLLMSSNSPPPLSLVCPQFSPPPRLAPDESLLCSPVFAYLPPLPLFYASRTIERPTQRGANPVSGRVTPGPMTIQTMKAWNSFPC